MRRFYMHRSFPRTRLRTYEPAHRPGVTYVELDAKGVYSMRNRADRDALRTLVAHLTTILCETDERVVDPSVCRACGYLDAECRCAK
jgi:hypothetical protein